MIDAYLEYIAQVDSSTGNHIATKPHTFMRSCIYLVHVFPVSSRIS